MVLICPVSEIFSSPEAKSQNLIVLSADPEAKYVLHGDTARHLTQPWWPAITRYSLKGLCQVGLISFLRDVARTVPNLVDSARFISNFWLSTTAFELLLSSSVVPIFFSYLAREVIF